MDGNRNRGRSDGFFYVFRAAMPDVRPTTSHLRRVPGNEDSVSSLSRDADRTRSGSTTTWSSRLKNHRTERDPLEVFIDPRRIEGTIQEVLEA